MARFPLRDATLDVEHPEILLYAPMPLYSREDAPTLQLKPFRGCRKRSYE
jgi:hypothetical protein